MDSFDYYNATVTTANGEEFDIFVDTDFYREHIDEKAPARNYDTAVEGHFSEECLTETMDSPLRLYGNVNSTGRMWCDRLTSSASSDS